MDLSAHENCVAMFKRKRNSWPFPIRQKRSPNLAAISLVLWVTTILAVLSVDRNMGTTTSLCQYSPQIVVNQSISVKPSFPKVAWLMSFPNSGTSYTLKLIRLVTNTTTATNYGHEHTLDGKSILLHQNWTNGPFRANASQAIPSHFVLTKTHCGSRCVHCAPDGYLESQRTFQRSCLMARRHMGSNISRESLYSPGLVHRAVHLVRNPLDNIVARFHLSRRREGSKFFNNATGFHQWCSRLDSQYLLYESHTPWLDSDVLRLWKDVPCHAEFFKYIEWHNLAMTTAHNMGIPVHVLRYEDYSQNLKSTIESLVSFLLLPLNSLDAAPVFEIHSYPSYYSPDQKAGIQKLIKNVASVPVWDIVKLYFEAK